MFCDTPTRVTETSSGSLDHILIQNIKGEGEVLQHKFEISVTTIQLSSSLKFTKQR